MKDKSASVSVPKSIPPHLSCTIASENLKKEDEKHKGEMKMPHYFSMYVLLGALPCGSNPHALSKLIHELVPKVFKASFFPFIEK